MTNDIHTNSNNQECLDLESQFILSNRQQTGSRDMRDMSISTTDSTRVSSPEVAGHDKYVPLVLSVSDKLYQTRIVVQNGQHWEDRLVMKELRKEYWKARGKWKRHLSEWNLWPWRKLHEIGYIKVKIFESSLILDRLESRKDITCTATSLTTALYGDLLKRAGR